MRMPIVDGLEVTRRIRALPGPRGRTPVVLVTADLVAIGRGRSGQTGVDVCVTKPFTRAELLAAVATAARITPAMDQDGRLPPAPGQEKAKAPGEPREDATEETALVTLKRDMGGTAFASQIADVTRRIESLLEFLEDPVRAGAQTTGDAVHDLVGIAGLLGLAEFGSSLTQFDTATDRAAHAPALRDAAIAALRTLRQPNQACRD